MIDSILFVTNNKTLISDMNTIDGRFVIFRARDEVVNTKFVLYDMLYYGEKR